MMKSLLAGVAAIAMVASAAAQTMDGTASTNQTEEEIWFECSVTKLAHEKDPVYKVLVSILDNGNDAESIFGKVLHVTQSGKVINRADQYDAFRNNHGAQGGNIWTGQHRKNKNLYLTGTFGVFGNTLYYKEWRPSTNPANQQTPIMESICHQTKG